MNQPRQLKLEKFLPYRLSITSNAVSDLIASSYQALFGLTIPEWRLVAILAEDDGVTQLHLCGVAHMDKVTVSRAAIRLVDRGLIQRTPTPGDKRSHLLSLTADGHALYKQIGPKALALENTLISNFSENEVALFMEMLKRLHHAAIELNQQSVGI